MHQPAVPTVPFCAVCTAATTDESAGKGVPFERLRRRASTAARVSARPAVRSSEAAGSRSSGFRLNGQPRSMP